MKYLALIAALVSAAWPAELLAGCRSVAVFRHHGYRYYAPKAVVVKQVAYVPQVYSVGLGLQTYAEGFYAGRLASQAEAYRAVQQQAQQYQAQQPYYAPQQQYAQPQYAQSGPLPGTYGAAGSQGLAIQPPAAPPQQFQAPPPQNGGPPPPPAPPQRWAWTQQTCVQCHTTKQEAVAKLNMANLDALPCEARLAAVAAIVDGHMPPNGDPGAEARANLIGEWSAAKTVSPPGAPQQ